MHPGKTSIGRLGRGCWATRLVDNKIEESRIRQIHLIQNSWVTMSLVINHHQITISINPPSSVMTVMTMIDWSKTKTQVALHASWICRCCWSKQVFLHDPGADWIRLHSSLYTEIPGFPKNARALNLIAYNAKKSTCNAKKSTFLHWLVKSCYVNTLVITWNKKTIKARLCKKGYRRTTGRDLNGRVLN